LGYRVVNQRQSHPAAVVGRFRQLRALVLGDPVLDSFLSGTPNRLCREQPVPVLLKAAEERKPGGAANVAANLRALGAGVALLGAIGADHAGEELTGCLRAADVDTSGLVLDSEQPTCHKLRVLAGDRYLARIDTERHRSPSPEVERRLYRLLEGLLPEADLVVVSDYRQGSVSAAAMVTVCRSSQGHCPVVLDAKHLHEHADAPVTLVTPNLSEALDAAGLPSLGEKPRRAELDTLAGKLRRTLSAESIAITMGPGGTLLIDGAGRIELLGAHPVVARSEVGAGDSLVAASALGLAAGMGVREALRLGMEAAALAVAKPLTATVTAAELSARLRRLGLHGEASTELCDALRADLSQARAEGLRIVFTNGVFDLLHEGHVDLLRRARALGDLLVVAINDDESSRRLKGEGRPINDAQERRAMLAALDCVDHVVVFEGLTASAVLAAVRPDVYVKGDDHDLEQLPEAAAAREVGARLVSVPRARRVSTSQIIDRVLSAGRPAASSA
jgi:D-beta-D-heptose 7-phosphate kinase/D-beta-D-heptose 1-phosphate adenosyltransferase